MSRQEKARWLSEIYAAVAEGKTLQILGADKVWRDTENFPYMASPTNLWRIKPEPREFETTVFSYGGESRVMVPRDWQPGTRVRVMEVLEDEH